MENAQSLEGQKLIIVGHPDPVQMGSHLYKAAKTLKLQTLLLNSTEAFSGPAWLVKYNWWFRGHYPTRLQEFSQRVVRECQLFRPSWLLATGMAPIESSALEAVRTFNILRLNYLTDDPWNPFHRASWFVKTLPSYDHIFSPRRSNRTDLHQSKCAKVSYLPFGYDPQTHFPEPPSTLKEQDQFSSDVVFIGGADSDRVPYIEALIHEGFRVSLWGGYWSRYRGTRAYGKGMADPLKMRKAIGGAKIALCLVRRANRDGHSMRTFEIPAIGACLLLEDTLEHRELFGDEKEAVCYFRNIPEMIEKAHELLTHDEERRRLAEAAHLIVTRGGHTYKDRLVAMLKRSGAIDA